MVATSNAAIYGMNLRYEFAAWRERPSINVERPNPDQPIMRSIRRPTKLVKPRRSMGAGAARETRLAAEQLKVAFLDSGAHDLDGLEASFAALAKQRPEALLVNTEPFTRLIETGFSTSP
jgi:hypothetical protein